MINAIENIQELSKTWRNIIISQSNLPAKNVLNGLSVRGVDLANYITEHISMSYSLKNIVAVFEIRYSDIDKNISMTEDDDTITNYASFKIEICLYGSASNEMAALLKSRLETEKCRMTLYNQGVHLKEVSEMNETHEFINETMWTRVDLGIDFSSRLSITQKEKYEDFEELNSFSTTLY